MRKRSPVVALALVVILSAAFGAFSPPAIRAQTAAAIAGTVVDAARAPIAGAIVTLHRDTRLVATTRTAADGTFLVPDVSAGVYRLTVAAAGMAPFSRDVVIGAAATTVRLSVVLLASTAKSHADDAGTRQESRVAEADAQRSAAAAPPPMTMPTPLGSAVPGGRGGMRGPGIAPWRGNPNPNYAHVDANRFHRTLDEPLSTFGADVDTASYANVRRFLSQGQLPPPDAVRVEELVNYFHFDYPAPRGGAPLALTAEIGDCPWAPGHKLVLIGARARTTAPRELAGRNIVLLVDVSGSMAPPERLPLLRSAFAMFVDTLRPDDRLAIVAYAGSSGIVLPSTPARARDVILRAIARLGAGGSTNGASGIRTVYDVARRYHVPGGVNRVILATDGDFNVGMVDRRELLDLIEREKRSGVFLTVLGVGTDNLKDATMEMLADTGNGNYAYLDTIQEARRVLVHEGDSTLETVAKDVKFQVEFNPARVGAWKLIGYENRLLAAEDFNDDRKDGGELGSGHAVTMLYEIVPADVMAGDPDARPGVDPLKYQPAREAGSRAAGPDTPLARGAANEWLTVKARFKLPEENRSDLIALPLGDRGRTTFLPFAASVAEYGLLLRDDPGNVSRWESLAERVRTMDVPPALAADRRDFAGLVDVARGLARIVDGREQGGRRYPQRRGDGRIDMTRPN